VTDLVGPQYLRVLHAFMSGGAVVRMGSCRLSDLAVLRRRLRSDVLEVAGVLAAGPPVVSVFVGQAEIRNLWARLTRTPTFAPGSAARASLDAVTFTWAPKIDAADDRAVLAVGLIAVLTRPDLDERTWTFVREDGTQSQWGPQ
jgi:hypothetical protein